MTKILPSLPQAIVEFASTNNIEPYSQILLKFVNACYPDLLMEGAEHQQQFLKVSLCWDVLMKMLFTLKS